MEKGSRLRSYFLGRASRSRVSLLAFFAFLFMVYIVSPYDGRLRSFLRFQHTVVSDYIQHKYPSDKWLFRTQPYPIDPATDIGIVIKTGYGTRKRVPRVLAALGNETFDADVMIVQDYPVIAHENTYNSSSGKSVPVVDIIGWMLDTKKLAGKEHVERIAKYRQLADAIDAEEWFLSDGLSKTMGWELDAMKVCGFPSRQSRFGILC